MVVELMDMLGVTGTHYEFIVTIFACFFVLYFGKQLFSLFGMMLRWK